MEDSTSFVTLSNNFGRGQEDLKRNHPLKKGALHVCAIGKRATERVGDRDLLAAQEDGHLSFNLNGQEMDRNGGEWKEDKAK